MSGLLFDDEVLKAKISCSKLLNEALDNAANLGTPLVRLSELSKKYGSWLVRDAIEDCELQRDMVTIQRIKLITQESAKRIIEYCESEVKTQHE